MKFKAHVGKAIRYFLSRPYDWTFLAIAAGIIVIGVMMIISTTSVVGISEHNDPYYFVKKEAGFLFVGIIAMVVGASVDHRVYKKRLIPGYLLASMLVALTRVPGIGVKLGGAHRWLNFGIFQFQPVEVMKFYVTVFLATALENKRGKMGNLKKGMLPILAFLLIPVLFVARQPDLGNVILILMVAFFLMFLAGISIKHMSTFFGLGALGVIVSLIINPYQRERIHSFLNPWADPLGKNYHVIQSLIAIGSGGAMGRGFGQSKLKFFYLPLQYSDFIFAMLCEEGGLLLAGVILILFSALAIRGFRIAMQASSDYGSYLVIGLLMFLVMQAFLNIGVVTGVFPVTGIPLTFISYGGTAFVTAMYFMGVILNVSAVSKEQE